MMSVPPVCLLPASCLEPSQPLATLAPPQPSQILRHLQRGCRQPAQQGFNLLNSSVRPFRGRLRLLADGPPADGHNLRAKGVRHGSFDTVDSFRRKYGERAFDVYT